MNTRIIALLGILISTASFASSAPEHRTTEKNAITSVSPRSSSLTAGTYSQGIDHFGALSGQTFAQRYWYDSEYASQATAQGDDAPVILHICGESEADAPDGYYLHDNAINWAKSLGAHLVYLEHRYYGKSQLFSDLSTDHMQYLTLDNVIEDLAEFQKWIATTQGWKGKWISVGGSYSGTLSAIYRYRHPELVVGALAASAPMISGKGTSEGTQGDADDASSTTISDEGADRQWLYQSCTTFGFWQASGEDFSSELEDPSSWLCQQAFGNVNLVDSAAYNTEYNAPFLANSSAAPSHILFTYGSDDVWTNLGLSQQANSNSNITIRTIIGAGHHYDLNYPSFMDSGYVKDARAAFTALAQQWLSAN
jgi:pimeloyl-ACP methyl ester carboxylesterase